MKTLSYVRTVLWAFFGVGRRRAARDQLARGNPLVLITVALVLAALFGLTLWGLANVAVTRWSTPVGDEKAAEIPAAIFQPGSNSGHAM